MIEQDQAAPLADRLDEAHERDTGDFGEPWKYKDESRLEGLIVRSSERDDGERPPFQILEVQRSDGTKVSVFCDKWKLRQLVETERPAVGDRVALGYYGMVSAVKDGNDWADFALVVDRQAELPADVAEDEARAQTQEALAAERDARDDWLPEGMS
jgi:hypothetical protein